MILTLASVKAILVMIICYFQTQNLPNTIFPAAVRVFFGVCAEEICRAARATLTLAERPAGFLG